MNRERLATSTFWGCFFFFPPSEPRGSELSCADGALPHSQNPMPAQPSEWRPTICCAPTQLGLRLVGTHWPLGQKRNGRPHPTLTAPDGFLLCRPDEFGGAPLRLTKAHAGAAEAAFASATDLQVLPTQPENKYYFIYSIGYLCPTPLVCRVFPSSSLCSACMLPQVTHPPFPLITDIPISGACGQPSGTWA